MKVYVIRDVENDHFRGVFSTFAIAKAAAKRTVVNDFIEEHGDDFYEEELKEILENFETTGSIDEVCYIKECTVDEIM